MTCWTTLALTSTDNPPTARAGILWYHVHACPFHRPDHTYERGVGQAPDGHYTGKCFHDQSKGWQEWKRALRLETRPSPSPARAGGQGQPLANGPRFARTDAGNAELFAHLYADRLRYDHRRKAWHVWSGHHWREDTDGEVTRLAIRAARERYRDAEDIVDLTGRQAEAKFATQSENRYRSDALLRAAGCLPPLATAGDHWDQDPAPWSRPWRHRSTHRDSAPGPAGGRDQALDRCHLPG